MNDFVNSLSGWWQWLEWLLWPLFVLVTLTVVFFTFSIIANLIGAPFNGFLAEAVELHLLGGPASDQGSTRIFQEIIKALRSESAKFIYFLSRAIPLLILMLVPGLQILWVLFGAWMLALEYMDYPMGNHGYTFSDERDLLKKRRLLVLGFGSGAMLMTLIPFVNFIVMPVAVAGATSLWVNEYSDS
jgi:CysZ protein